MATGPYIIHKSSQFCAAVRSNVDFDNSVRKRIREVTFCFNGVAMDTLPPRLNLKSLSTAVNAACQQFREKGVKYLINKQDVNRARKELRGQFYSQTSEGDFKTCENSIAESSTFDVRLLDAAGFRWDKERVTDYELYRCKKNVILDKKRKRRHKEKGTDNKEWEQFINQKLLEVWRRPVDSSGLYEYKVFGTFYDINARSFYNIQVDNEYRAVWDQFALKLDVVDLDPMSGSEVLHWVTKFPYPLRNRDYVFVRRGQVDQQSMTMVLISRATTHPLCPENSDHVRVQSYNSRMVILPHRTFDEDGFDFVLSYFDDPKTNFPSYCMNVLTSSNLPTFINTLHSAAAGLSQQDQKCLAERQEMVKH